jgi:tetratricopeptide (TPR) repeat protein
MLGLAGMIAASSIPVSAHGTHSTILARVDEHLAAQPLSGDLWYQRGVLEFEHEDWAAAALDFENAQRHAPGKFPVLWWQGRILDQQGNFQDAKSALDRFLAETPGHWGGLASRARIEARLGMHREALDDFRAALAAHPEAGPDLVDEVAQALARNGAVDEAVRVLEVGIKRLGPIPSLQLKVIEVEVAARRFDSALSRLDAMQRSAPRPEPWMEKRASILAQAGRHGESRAAWQALVNHLESLPAIERDSHSMVLLSERARQALAVLESANSPPVLN